MGWTFLAVLHVRNNQDIIPFLQGNIDNCHAYVDLDRHVFGQLRKISKKKSEICELPRDSRFWPPAERKLKALRRLAAKPPPGTPMATYRALLAPTGGAPEATRS